MRNEYYFQDPRIRDLRQIRKYSSKRKKDLSTSGDGPCPLARFSEETTDPLVANIDSSNTYLTENDAKELLVDYVSQNCCFSRRPLRNLQLEYLSTTSIYKYVLETFIETRTTSRVCRPFNLLYDDEIAESRRDVLKKLENLVWTIDVRPKRFFQNQKIKIELQNASYIESCSSCFGRGSTTCNFCQGYSKRLCSYCQGTGMASYTRSPEYTYGAKPSYSDYNFDGAGHNRMWNPTYENNQLSLRAFLPFSNFSSTNNWTNLQRHPFDQVFCSFCDGKRYVNCTECDSGRMECENCESTGRLKWAVELTVCFDTIRDEHFDKQTLIPQNLIQTANARNIYFEQDEKLEPLVNQYEFKLGKASNFLLKEHEWRSQYSNSRILAQRHSVYQIPVALCKYLYKKKLNQFCVYGYEQRVYCLKYPKKCCFLF